MKISRYAVVDTANQRLAHPPASFATQCATGSLAAVLFLLASMLGGCTNVSIAKARSEIALGHYAAAHQTLARASTSSGLSEREQREVADGLCLTEYKIGAPQYSLSQQHRACARAVAAPGSESQPILEQVETAERTEWSERAATAIRDRDFAEAENAVVHYQSLPDADPRMISAWSGQLWADVAHDDPRAKPHSHVLAPAISHLTRQYPQVTAMSSQSFRRWVADNTTIAGTPLVSDIRIGKRMVDLWIPGNHLAIAAINLDRFARVNDALVARCRCDARTAIAMQGSDLPAYLVRLDPATRQSEVLILAQP
jgi:hypothetical protein